ncbi:MAG: nucleoside triphosphate pyrophosphohydrolase [Myxococcota bacterium]
MSNKPLPSTDDQSLIAPTSEARQSFGAAFERLVGIMARLRGEGGCPWDREQDLKTLRPYLVEEAYEVLEAIDHGTAHDHQEELGDLMLQVVFQAEIRRQAGAFDVADVAHGISDKLVRRHPHVFGDLALRGIDEIWANWEEIKKAEKGRRSVTDGVPRALPALLRAQRTTEKASRVGFDWTSIDGPLEKLKEEMAELEAARASGNRQRVEEELGDVLFTVVNAARFLEVSAEDALQGAVDRFKERFMVVEDRVKESGRAMKDVPMSELDRYWNEAKAQKA